MLERVVDVPPELVWKAWTVSQGRAERTLVWNSVLLPGSRHMTAVILLASGQRCGAALRPPSTV